MREDFLVNVRCLLFKFGAARMPCTLVRADVVWDEKIKEEMVDTINSIQQLAGI